MWRKQEKRDRFTDIAFDAQYQYMGTIEAEHMQQFVLNAYLH